MCSPGSERTEQNAFFSYMRFAVARLGGLLEIQPSNRHSAPDICRGSFWVRFSVIPVCIILPIIYSASNGLTNTVTEIITLAGLVK